VWVEKYRPTNPNTMIGNEDVRIQFINWLKKWKRKSKPALLLGPPGVGKTTLVYSAAKSLDYEILELNASDVRTKNKLEENLGPTSLNKTLFDEKLLIFLDEIDGIYGRQDKGGLEFIQTLMKNSEKPLVMVANVEEDKKIMKIAKGSKVFKFQRIPPKLLEIVIKNILRREELSLSQESIEEIVKNSKGDVRSAVNSSQVAATGNGEALPMIRDVSLGMKEALKLFFESSSRKEAYLALRWCNIQPREKIRAIYNSIMSSDVEIEKLIKILNELSKADELLHEIGRTQNYRLLRYFDQILSDSLFNELKGEKVRYGEQIIPWNLQLRIWNERKQLENIANKLAQIYHVSRKDAMILYLPYISLISNVKKTEGNLIESLKLNDVDAKVLKKEMQRIAEEVH